MDGSTRIRSENGWSNVWERQSKSNSRIMYVEWVPGEHRCETRQCSKPTAFHLSKKGMFLYSAVSSSLDAQSALHVSSPGRPVHSDTNSASLGSILAMQQLRNDYSLTFPPLSIARYYIYTAESTEASWRERKFPNFYWNYRASGRIARRTGGVEWDV